MKKVYSYIPKYSILPLSVLIIVHLFNFYGTRLIANGFKHYDLTLALDRAIPFVPAFIVIYILAYVQWGYGIWYGISHGRETCFRFIASALIGEVICIAVFIIMPTELVRTPVTGGDVFSKITGLIYSLDEPNNLFPSLHCFASWLCFRIIFYVEKEKRSKAYTIGSFVFTLLVFASTVFVKQHVVVDILGGVALVEISMLIEKLTGAHRLLEKIDDKLSKKDDVVRKE